MRKLQNYNYDMKALVFCLFFLLQNVSCHMPNVYEFCSYVVAHQDPTQVPSSSCDTQACQARPGKRGSPGLAGSKGSKGDQGVCDLKRLEFLEELNHKIQMIPKSSYCLLGVKNHDVQDYAMTASNSLAKHEPYFGRLDGVTTTYSGGAWCAPADPGIGEWIQVDLGKDRSVSGVVTQGSNAREGNYVTSFKVACARISSTEKVSFITQNGKEAVFVGNSDQNTKIFNLFPGPITCQFVRIYPQSWNNENKICMRFDLLHGHCHGRSRYQFRVRSAGLDSGNLAEIEINGVNHQLGASRGHNIVVLNAKSLKFESKVFDTHVYNTQVKQMIAYLKQVPYGSLIAMAVNDSTMGTRMDDTDVAYMKALGAGGDGCPIRLGLRDSWSFVTEKVMQETQFPEWKNCSFSPRYGSVASVEATVHHGRYYNIDDIPMP